MSSHALCFQQRALYSLGLTGIPITNVNNNCSTGSTALYNANNLVKAGLIDCAIALGFERMNRGSLGSAFPDRPSPGQIFGMATIESESRMSAGENFGPGWKSKSRTFEIRDTPTFYGDDNIWSVYDMTRQLMNTNIDVAYNLY